MLSVSPSSHIFLSELRDCGVADRNMGTQGSRAALFLGWHLVAERFALFLIFLSAALAANSVCALNAPNKPGESAS
jgi:hypothetical protein